MQLSDKRIAANQANVRKSTGPKNPFTRRYAAHFENLANAVLIDGESRESFIELLKSLYAQHQPETPDVHGWSIKSPSTIGVSCVRGPLIRPPS